MKSNFLQEASLNNDILFNIKVHDYDFLLCAHNQPDRFYHTWNHIDEVIYEIETFKNDELIDD